MPQPPSDLGRRLDTHQIDPAPGAHNESNKSSWVGVRRPMTSIDESSQALLEAQTSRCDDETRFRVGREKSFARTSSRRAAAFAGLSEWS
jgi:hypothetical protein